MHVFFIPIISREVISRTDILFYIFFCDQLLPWIFSFAVKIFRHFWFNTYSVYESGCRVNVVVGALEERMMLSGLHTVADIFCCCCGQIIGWKYVISPSFTCIDMYKCLSLCFHAFLCRSMSCSWVFLLVLFVFSTIYISVSFNFRECSGMKVSPSCIWSSCGKKDICGIKFHRFLK